MNRGEHMNGGLEPDVVPVVEALDALAGADRAAMPAGLPGRVYRASVAGLSARPEPVVYSFAGVARTRRGLAMAASIAIVGAAAAVWLAGGGPGASAQGAALASLDWDALAVDEAWNATGDSVDRIAADAEDVARAVGGSWLPEDIFASEAINGESM